jgi:hypothetical protein
VLTTGDIFDSFFTIAPQCFVCEFGGEGMRGLWRERKLKKFFIFFEKLFFIKNDK